MWRYYVLCGDQVLFRSDVRQDAVEKARELAWSRGTGSNPCVVVRAMFRFQLAVDKRDDV